MEDRERFALISRGFDLFYQPTAADRLEFSSLPSTQVPVLAGIKYGLPKRNFYVLRVPRLRPVRHPASMAPRR